MVASETQQKAIALGELLVAELGRRHQADMLSRWMAHYIAEQLTLSHALVRGQLALAA